MNEKTIKTLVYGLCLIAPLLPTYIVLVIIAPLISIYGIIVISVVEYFGFQYIVAFFIKRVSERQMEKTKRLRMKEKLKE
jgi:hypothetical protein